MMPTIRIDDEVYAWLQQQGRPFVDTPNSVLRRVAGLDGAPNPRTLNVKHAFTTGEMERMKRDAIAAGVRSGDIIEREHAEQERSMDVKLTQTSLKAFREPILKCLKKMGGSGSRKRVLKQVEKPGA
jgi:hypothetical protein